MNDMEDTDMEDPEMNDAMDTEQTRRIPRSPHDADDTEVLHVADAADRTVELPLPAGAVDETEPTRAMPAVPTDGVDAGADDADVTAPMRTVSATPDDAPTPDDPAPASSQTPRPSQTSLPPQTPIVHQVPRDTPEPPAETRPTGPAAATIVFGVLLLACGGLALAVGLQFPWWLPTFAVDGRVAVALVCGGVGVMLILAAIIWSVVGLIRPKHR